MYKRTAAIAAAALALTVPMVLPAGAQNALPDRGSMPMSAKSSSNGNMGSMSATDMLKRQIKAAQRLEAAANAKALGKPSQLTAHAQMNPGGVPDYWGASPNYANSPLPHITWKSAGSVNGTSYNAGDNVVLPSFDPSTGGLTDPITGNAVAPAESPYAVDTTGNVISDPINNVPQLDTAKVSISGGIRKFIEPLPGVGAADPQTTVQNCSDAADQTTCSAAYLPVAVPDTTTYPGSDYYVIGLKDYYQQFSPDLPPTKLRGYFQINAPGGAMKPYYLGPVIQARANIPVRVKFINMLPTGQAGNLFLPVDTTMMGDGLGPQGAAAGNYPQNRATLHLHGGLTPWISDGTPHQWTTPAGENTAYPEGVSVKNVPDMDGGNEPQGTLTFFYTNQQSARLLWYHDHTYGLTRVNVYAGEAAAYPVSDPVEQEMIMGTDAWLAANPDKTSHFATPVPAGTIPSDSIPLVIQDKTFTPDNQPSGYFPDGQLAAEDPTWDFSKWGGSDNLSTAKASALWYPHVYMVNQNPYDNSGANAMGRWDYGPWFWPVFGTSAGLMHGEVPNPYANASSPWEPPMIPGVPSVSLTPESFMDTPVVNGVAYPYMNVQPKAYRFRILNAANDRSWNLQLYCAKSNANMWNADGTLNDANAGEVPMVPAVKNLSYPADWPTDGRDGGVPDPAARATNFLQFGNESGFLPNLVTLRNGPVGYNYNRRDIVVLNVQERALWIGPAERAEVVVDFSKLPAGCTNVILYNDAPAPAPAFDTRYDYYTNDPDQQDSGGAPSTLPGYGPDTRTIMQFRVDQTATPQPFDAATLASYVPQAFAVDQHKPIVPETAFKAAYPNDVISSQDTYSRIQNTSLSFPADIAGITATLTDGGSGYLNGPATATISAPAAGGTQATATPTFTAGKLTGLTITNGGSRYTSGATVTISPPTNGTTATASLLVNNAGRVVGYTITDQGSGYFPAQISIGAPPAGGTQATATATVTNGVVTGITLTNSGSGYSTPPSITFSPSAGNTATATTALAPVTVQMQPKTIQELFEMDYGRMNATLGVEMPFTNSNNQTTLPMGYAEPSTEIVSPTQIGTQIGTLNNGVQLWKITHNGVDTHFIHFHLFDVQVLNRVGWDGAIRPPEANEVGWKDTVRMNPLEDIVVALRPITPVLPFKIGDSIRPLDPTLPVGANVTTFNPTTGQAVTVTNAMTNFGWEYVWHCHILGHEENDMMRPIEYQASPAAPTIRRATSPVSATGAAQTVVSWTNNANWLLTNFVLQRATDKDFTQNVVQTDSGKPVAPVVANFGSLIPSSATSYTDTSVTAGTTYYYRVRAEGESSYSVWSSPVSVRAVATPPAVPTNFRAGPVLQVSALLAWSEANTPPATSFTMQVSTASDFASAPVTSYNIAGNLRSYTISGLTSNTRYYLRINATGAGGTSAWSSVLSMKTAV